MNEREIAAGLAPTPGYRYSDEVDGRLYVAGEVPHDRSGHLVGPGDPQRQATACLDNLRLLVEAYGYELADVRRLTIHVVGAREDLSAAWHGVTAFFADDVPPATLLGVPVLGHADQLVEVDAEVVRRR